MMLILRRLGLSIHLWPRQQERMSAPIAHLRQRRHLASMPKSPEYIKDSMAAKRDYYEVLGVGRTRTKRT